MFVCVCPVCSEENGYCGCHLLVLVYLLLHSLVCVLQPLRAFACPAMCVCMCLPGACAPPHVHVLLWSFISLQTNSPRILCASKNVISCFSLSFTCGVVHLFVSLNVIGGDDVLCTHAWCAVLFCACANNFLPHDDHVS